MRKMFFLVSALVLLAVIPSLASSGLFYSTDIATITAAGSHTTASDSIDVSEAQRMLISAYATGQSTAATSNVTVYIYTSPDGTNWDTEPYTSFTFVADSTTTATMYSVTVNVSGANKVRLNNIANGNASYELYDVNAYWAIKLER